MKPTQTISHFEFHTDCVIYITQKFAKLLDRSRITSNFELKHKKGARVRNGLCSAFK